MASNRRGVPAVAKSCHLVTRDLSSKPHLARLLLVTDLSSEGQAGPVTPRSLITGGAMSAKGIADKSNSDSVSARWAALDSRLERLANASERMLTDRDSKDRDCELKAAS